MMMKRIKLHSKSTLIQMINRARSITLNVNMKKFILSYIIKLKIDFSLVISKVKHVYILGVDKTKYRVRASLDIIINKVYISVSRVKKVICIGLEFIKKVVGVIIGYLKTLVKKVLKSIMLITLDRLFALTLGAIFIASLKYTVSGCLSVN